MGKSLISTRGILLGQQYQKVIASHLDPLIAIIKSLPSNLTKGFPFASLNPENNPITLELFAYQLNLSHQEAFETLYKFASIAYQDRHTAVKMQEYLKQIDNQVAHQLEIDLNELEKWMNDLSIELELENTLTKLGTHSIKTDLMAIEENFQQLGKNNQSSKSCPDFREALTQISLPAKAIQQPLPTKKLHSTLLQDFPQDPSSFSNELDLFINQFENYIENFTHPLHLIKLQHILHSIDQKIFSPQKIETWKIKIQDYMQRIMTNMDRHHQRSLSDFLDYGNHLNQLYELSLKTIYRHLSLIPPHKFDFSKGRLKTKVEFIHEQAIYQISQLKDILKILNSPSPLNLNEFELLMQKIPPSLKEIFIYIVALETKKHSLSNLSDPSQQIGDVLSKDFENLSNNFNEILEKDGFTAFTQQYLMNRLSRNRRIPGHRSLPNFNSQDLLHRVDLFPLKESQVLPEPPPKKDFAIPLDHYEALMEGLKEGVNLMIEKLTHVAGRQDKRLAALEENQSIIFPHYFHATNFKKAALIVQTSIQASDSPYADGSFISNQVEFCQSPISIGLPQTVEFSSDIHTFMDKNTSPEIIRDDKCVWIGLKDSIIINPQLISLKKKFMDAIQSILSRRFKELDLIKTPEKIELEVRILEHFDKGVQFKPKYLNGKLKWKLSYRLLEEQRTVEDNPIVIKQKQDLHLWAKQVFKEVFSMHQPPLLKQQLEFITKKFLTNFEQEFETLYYIGHPSPSDFSVENPLEKKIQAVIIAPDDDETLKEIYSLKLKNSKKASNVSEFKTYSQVKEEFAQWGLDETKIDFIPLTEQLLENDFLNQIETVIPKGWNQVNYRR